MIITDNKSKTDACLRKRKGIDKLIDGELERYRERERIKVDT